MYVREDAQASSRVAPQEVTLLSRQLFVMGREFLFSSRKNEKEDTKNVEQRDSLQDLPERR